MSVAQQLSVVTADKKQIPEKIRRELRIGETIYHSAADCYVSGRYPTGKWVAQVRREEQGRLIKYPVKAFGTPLEALGYVKSLRPDAKGRVHAPTQGEATVSELFAFARQHSWKRLSQVRRDIKESRWRLHIEPYWGDMPLSSVTRRAVQTWITEVEEKIASGEECGFGIPTLTQARMDLHGLFEVAGIFDARYEDRQNPFRGRGLTFSKCTPRVRTCLESPYFPAIDLACSRLVEEGLATDWIVAMFSTGLFGGCRQGEIMALCRDQIDFDKGTIRIDRAVRDKEQELDPVTMKPAGPVLRLAIHLPKGDKARVIPMSDQLAAILRPFYDRPGVAGAKWDLLFPSEAGGLKEPNRLATAFGTLCKRLDEVAKKEAQGGRGLKRNVVVEEFKICSLPDVWGKIVFRDGRNSFASYAEEVLIPQATREAVLGHGPEGVTDRHYTDVTAKALEQARQKLTDGWTRL